MKIDVDGGKLDVLRGLSYTLSGDACRLIFCEVHPGPLSDYGENEQAVLDELRDLGYSLSKRDLSHESRRDEYFIAAQKYTD